MRCNKVKKLIVAYLDNELSVRKQDSLQAHIAKCPVCSAELESYKKLNGIIEQFPKVEDRSPLYWQNQMKAIERKVAEVQSGKKPEPTVQLQWSKPVWGKLAAASVTISVVAIILFLNVINQPATTILPKENKESKMILAEKPAAAIAEKSDKERILQPTRVSKFTAPIASMDEMKKKDSTAPAELEYASVDKILPKEEKSTAPMKKMESATVGTASREIAVVSISTTPVAEEPKYAKGAFPLSKAARNYASSTISATKAAQEFGLGTQVLTAGDSLATSGIEGVGLARGTSVFFAGQQAEQVALYDHGTVTPASPLAIQSVNNLNLAFDSAQRKLMQEAMEMMIKTNSPDRQNQRMIEIREMPQPGGSSTRHLQIKMEFNEK